MADNAPEVEAPAVDAPKSTNASAKKKIGSRIAGLKTQAANIKPPTVKKEMFVNEEEGLYLGRTPASWAKIGIFYIVYYVLLYIIFIAAVGFSTNSLTSINFKKDDGSLVYKPKIRTRVDQPGLSVYPHNNLDEGRRADGVLSWDSNNNDAIREVTQILFQRLIKPNLESCPEENPVSRYSRRPLDTHGSRSSLIRRQYGSERMRPLVILKVNRLIDWTPKPVKRVEGDLREDIEEFHKGNIYFTCKGYETTDVKGKVKKDKNFKSVHFLNPNITEDANGCEKAGSKVGCLPVAWFDKYQGNDPFQEMRDLVSSTSSPSDKDPCDAEEIENEKLAAKCELQEADRLDRGYKKNLQNRNILPKIVHKSCWPFMTAIIEAHDINKPVKVQCKAWLGNTNIPENTSAEDVLNNVETVFGFRDLSECDPNVEYCDNGGWY